MAATTGNEIPSSRIETVLDANMVGGGNFDWGRKETSVSIGVRDMSDTCGQRRDAVDHSDV